MYMHICQLSIKGQFYMSNLTQLCNLKICTFLPLFCKQQIANFEIMWLCQVILIIMAINLQNLDKQDTYTYFLFIYPSWHMNWLGNINSIEFSEYIDLHFWLYMISFPIWSFYLYLFREWFSPPKIVWFILHLFSYIIFKVWYIWASS